MSNNKVEVLCPNCCVTYNYPPAAMGNIDKCEFCRETFTVAPFLSGGAGKGLLSMFTLGVAKHFVRKCPGCGSNKHKQLSPNHDVGVGVELYLCLKCKSTWRELF